MLKIVFSLRGFRYKFANARQSWGKGPGSPCLSDDYRDRTSDIHCNLTNGQFHDTTGRQEGGGALIHGEFYGRNSGFFDREIDSATVAANRVSFTATPEAPRNASGVNCSSLSWHKRKKSKINKLGGDR